MLRKLLIVLLLNLFLFANINEYNNTNSKINKPVENNATELSHLTNKNKYEEFINKLEFTTFCTEKNLKNNEVRKTLNEFVVYLEQKSVENILFAILAFYLFRF